MRSSSGFWTLALVAFPLVLVAAVFGLLLGPAVLSALVLPAAVTSLLSVLGLVLAVGAAVVLPVRAARGLPGHPALAPLPGDERRRQAVRATVGGSAVAALIGLYLLAVLVDGIGAATS